MVASAVSGMFCLFCFVSLFLCSFVRCVIIETELTRNVSSSRVRPQQPPSPPPQTWLEHGDDTARDKKSDADFADVPKRLVRVLVDTASACRLDLSEAALAKLGLFASTLTSRKDGAVGGDQFTLNDVVEKRHRRLARWLNSEDRSWDAVYKCMDAYVQRLGTSGKSNAPCEEYTLLKKKGHQILLAFKRKSTSRM